MPLVHHRFNPHAEPQGAVAYDGSLNYSGQWLEKWLGRAGQRMGKKVCCLIVCRPAYNVPHQLCWQDRHPLRACDDRNFMEGVLIKQYA